MSLHNGAHCEPKSRVREIRSHGSEGGGGANQCAVPPSIRKGSSPLCINHVDHQNEKNTSRGQKERAGPARGTFCEHFYLRPRLITLGFPLLLRLHLISARPRSTPIVHESVDVPLAPGTAGRLRLCGLRGVSLPPGHGSRRAAGDRGRGRAVDPGDHPPNTGGCQLRELPLPTRTDASRPAAELRALRPVRAMRLRRGPLRLHGGLSRALPSRPNDRAARASPVPPGPGVRYSDPPSPICRAR